MLSKEKFDILNSIYNKTICYRDIDKFIDELKNERLLDDGLNLTSKALGELEYFKVDNAIIMAAGLSSRFAPLSYENPKALLTVKGEVLIEREIRQLQEVGISDITIVVGYMKEKFFYLKEKFNVDIVENDDFYRYNNTSSLILVTEKMKNTYICSSDNYFAINPFEKYVYQSYYSAVFSKGETDEYCVSYDSDGRITNVVIGGKSSWYMLGHVYFDKSFSEKFVEILKREYENEQTKASLWEDLYIRYISDLDMYIRKYEDNIINEFDSLDELRMFDNSYIDNSNSKILKSICNELKCNESDIIGIKPIKNEKKSLSFSFFCKGEKYSFTDHIIEKMEVVG